MNIPQSENLHSQTFNAELMEFVWLFQERNGINRFIFGITKTQSDPFPRWLCYIESGKINSIGNYISEPFYVSEFGIERLIDKNNWERRGTPPLYDKFSNGEDLKTLHDEAMEYLK